MAVLGGKFLGAVADALRGEELFAARATGDTAAERALGGCGCFPAGTGVLTPHGLMAIASLHAGDTVLAEDTKTGRVEPERVRAAIDDGVRPTIAVGLSDGSSLQVTTNHPFYVDGGPGIAGPEWLAAGDLQLGDRLRTEDGRDVTVTALRYHAGYAHVYTLTVAADHDYFVGGSGVLVHNNLPEECPFSESQVTRARKAASKATDNAGKERVRYATDAHPEDHHFTRAMIQDILANPDAVYLSTGGEGTLIFRKGTDIVVTDGPGSGQGQVVTAYGPSGILGDSGARAYPGSLPGDPGRAVTHEMIVSGTVPKGRIGGGYEPPAWQIWP